MKMDVSKLRLGIENGHEMHFFGQKILHVFAQNNPKIQIFVWDKMTEKKNFPFSVILSKTNICLRRNDRKREILFFGTCGRNKYLGTDPSKKIKICCLILLTN